MRSEKRIEELEGHVRELADMIERLTGGRKDSNDLRRARELAKSPSSHQALAERAAAMPASSQVWLERLTVLLGLVFMGMAARFVQESGTLTGLQKIGAGYAVGLVLLAYGGGVRRARNLFAEALVGCGAAGIYLTTYALFFLDSTLAGKSPLGIGALAICLVALAWGAHYTRSMVVAAIGIFTAYATVIYGLHQAAASGVSPEAELVFYALAACPLLAGVVTLLQAAQGWTMLVVLAMLISHGVYDRYLLEVPWGTDMYFLLSVGDITFCWLLFSASFVISVVRFDLRGRSTALAALINSLGYLVLTRPHVAAPDVEYLWQFLLGVALVHVVLALFVETRGPRPNYMFQAFLFCVVLAMVETLGNALEGEWLPLSYAGLSIVFILLSRLTGVVSFKPYSVLLLVLSVVHTLGYSRFYGETAIAGLVLPTNWFAALGTVALLTFGSCLSEHFVRRWPRPEWITSGQHAFAGTWLDFRGPVLAIFPATAIAFILLTMTIFDFGEDLRLPFLLAAEAFAMGVIGLVLFTPPLEIASVLLLAAGHVCYHVFLWLPQPGFEYQEEYFTLTATFALVTYIGAYAWERYLRRLHLGAAEDWEHHAIAAFPHLAATAVLATLLIRGLAPVHVPAALALLGASLLLVGALTRLNGIKASGIVAVALAAHYFQLGLYAEDASIAKDPEFPVHFAALLAAFVASERLLVILQRYESFPSLIEDALRSALVFLSTVLGLLGLYAWNPAETLVFHLFGAASVFTGLGALFRDRRYYWGALGFLCATVYAAVAQFTMLTQPQQIAVSAAAALLLLGGAAAYTRHRRQGNLSPRNPVHHDG